MNGQLHPHGTTRRPGRAGPLSTVCPHCARAQVPVSYRATTRYDALRFGNRAGPSQSTRRRRPAVRQPPSELHPAFGSASSPCAPRCRWSARSALPWREISRRLPGFEEPAAGSARTAAHSRRASNVSGLRDPPARAKGSSGESLSNGEHRAACAQAGDRPRRLKSPRHRRMHRVCSGLPARILARAGWITSARRRCARPGWAAWCGLTLQPGLFPKPGQPRADSRAMAPSGFGADQRHREGATDLLALRKPMSSEGGWLTRVSAGVCSGKGRSASSIVAAHSV